MTSKVLAVAAVMLMGGFSSAFAESLNCTTGKFLSITGKLENELFTARATVIRDGVKVIDVQNLKYKKSSNGDSAGSFVLQEDAASQSVKSNDPRYGHFLHFVPEELELELIDQPRMAYLLLAPTEKDPKTRLIKTLLICEKAVYPLTEKEAIEELQNKKKMQERIDRIKKDLGWIQ